MTTSTLPQATQLGDAVLTRRQIASIVAGLGKQIDAYYLDKAPLVFVPILKGAFYFCADLSREILTPHTIELIVYRSYTSGLRSDGYFVGLDSEGLRALEVVRGVSVLIVDTIKDSGKTYEAVKALLTDYRPASIEGCVLIARSTVKPPRFVGSTAHNRKLFYGYGLDVDGAHRHLQAIYAR